jgi:hypothetical protein
MAQTSPPGVSALPTAPQTTDGSVLFASRSDAFVAALATFRTQLVALGSNIYDNCVDAFNSATAAASSAVAALASQTAAATSAVTAASAGGATVWAAGTFSAGATRYSPIDGRIYRARTGHTGSTDPSADATNWGLVALSQPVLVTVSATTHTAAAGTCCMLTNVAATTVTLPPSPAVDDVVWVIPANGLTTNSIARNGRNIMSLAEDMTIDKQHVTVSLRYVDATRGWRIV